MSGEFGEWESCNSFHDKIRSASEDKDEADYEVSKLWCEFLEIFSNVARAISYAEACDSDEESAIEESIERIPELRKKLNDIEKTLRKQITPICVYCGKVLLDSDYINQIILYNSTGNILDRPKIQYNHVECEKRHGAKVLGTVAWYNKKKGYGYIDSDRGYIFIDAPLSNELEAGDRVEFTIINGNNGAEAVGIIKES